MADKNDNILRSLSATISEAASSIPEFTRYPIRNKENKTNKKNFVFTVATDIALLQILINRKPHLAAYGRKKDIDALVCQDLSKAVFKISSEKRSFKPAQVNRRLYHLKKTTGYKTPAVEALLSRYVKMEEEGKKAMGKSSRIKSIIDAGVMLEMNI